MHHECYVCAGTGVKLTKDHIFPRGLFPPPLPRDMLTAPACEECQQRLQPDEEYFRTLVASGAYSDETARELWDGKIKRSFDNSPGFRQTFANAIRVMEWKSPGGIVLGDIPVIEGDQERTGNVLRKIVRGVFYLGSGRTVMPFDVKFNFYAGLADFPSATRARATDPVRNSGPDRRERRQVSVRAVPTGSPDDRVGIRVLPGHLRGLDLAEGRRAASTAGEGRVADAVLVGCQLETGGTQPGGTTTASGRRTLRWTERRNRTSARSRATIPSPRQSAVRTPACRSFIPDRLRQRRW